MSCVKRYTLSCLFLDPLSSTSLHVCIKMLHKAFFKRRFQKALWKDFLNGVSSAELEKKAKKARLDGKRRVCGAYLRRNDVDRTLLTARCAQSTSTSQGCFFAAGRPGSRKSDSEPKECSRRWSAYGWLNNRFFNGKNGGQISFEELFELCMMIWMEVRSYWNCRSFKMTHYPLKCAYYHLNMTWIF